MGKVIHLNRDLKSLAQKWLDEANDLQGLVCIGINKDGNPIHQYGWNSNQQFAIIGLLETIKKIMIEESID